MIVTHNNKTLLHNDVYVHYLTTSSGEEFLARFQQAGFDDGLGFVAEKSRFQENHCDADGGFGKGAVVTGEHDLPLRVRAETDLLENVFYQMPKGKAADCQS